MSDQRVTLAVWRNAQTDPPGYPGGVITDKGLAWYAHTPDHQGPWYSELGAYGSPPLNPQPSWWCDPQPPGEDALTVDDTRYALRRAAREAEDDALLMHVSDVNGDGEAFYVRRAAHLRSALEGLK